MAGIAHQRWLVAALLGLLLIGASSSRAAAVDETIEGRSTERGVEISVERFSPGRRAPGGGASETSPSSSRCSLFPWIFEPGTAKGGIPPTPHHRRFLVSCDHQAVGTTWIGPADTLAEAASRAIEIAAIAERVLREIPVGEITIGRRPRGRSLTGLPVYVWVEGYDGRPIVETVQELGVTVDVRVALRHVAWDFGDGTPPLGAGLGEPWPRRSSVHHTYATTSPHDRPYAVAAQLTLSAEYRVDGGSWQALAPLTRSAVVTIDVDQVQAVRNR